MILRLLTKNKKGITLIETVLSTSIMVVVIAGALAVLNFGENSFEAIDNAGVLQTQAYEIMTHTSCMIRESYSLSLTEDTPTQLVSGTRDGNTVRLVWDDTSGILSIIDDMTGNSTIIGTNVQNLSIDQTETEGGIEIYARLVLYDQTYEFKTTEYKRY